MTNLDAALLAILKVVGTGVLVTVGAYAIGSLAMTFWNDHIKG